MSFSEFIYPSYSDGLKEKILQLKNTPTVVYDKNFIVTTVENIKQDLSINKNNQLLFAMKANNNPEILKIFYSCGIGIDVASISEYSLAYNIGFQKISAMNPCFDERDFEKFSDNVLIDIDSLSQLKKFLKIFKNGREFGIRIKNYGEYSAYGVDIDDEIFNYIRIKKIQKNFTRLHFHNSHRSIEELKKQLEIARKLIYKFPYINTINIGGDLLNLYNSGRKNFLNTIYQITQDSDLKNITFIFEPGDALIKYGGILVTKARAIKKDGNKNNVFLDSSPWISSPWLTGKPIILNNSNNGKSIPYYLLGNTMYSGDRYYNQAIYFPEIKENDYLIFPEYGAYTLSNYRGFHLMDKPTEYLYENQQLVQI